MKVCCWLTRISATEGGNGHLLPSNWIKCRRCEFDETASRRAWHLQFCHVVQNDGLRDVTIPCENDPFVRARESLCPPWIYEWIGSIYPDRVIAKKLENSTRYTCTVYIRMKLTCNYMYVDCVRRKHIDFYILEKKKEEYEGFVFLKNIIPTWGI